VDTTTGKPTPVALETVLARHLILAERLARGIVGRDAGVALDVVHETVQVLLERQRAGKLALESEAHARNYFLRAVHNRAVDVRAQGERERVLPDEVAAPGGDPARVLGDAEAHSSELAALREALAALPDDERELVRLRYLEGRALREIAERTGAPISTLHSRLGVVLTRIRARIGKRAGGQ
jgi:RNA polymerase sigma-70 factor (ECF subfamily)